MQDGAATPISPLMTAQSLLLLPWVLVAIALALLGGAAWIWFEHRRRPKLQPLPTEWTLAPRPVFNADERNVYRQLREALPHSVILSKLPLVRFCQPIDPQEVRYWFELLGNTHVTFAICSSNGRVLAAVDVEQDRHNSKRTLHIKQQMLSACRVRYLRCSAAELPSLAELQLLVPQPNGMARGPQAAPSGFGRDTGPGALASRRRERATLWQDSSFLQDSFFGTESRTDFGAPSGFSGLNGLRGRLRDEALHGARVRELRGSAAYEVGGVVTETAGSRLRH